MKRLFLLFSLFLALTATHADDYFRGVWISTVVNIDWPSKEAVGNSKMQQQEMTDLLDSLAALHFNAVFFQVRPCSDAVYKSDIEPWSEWLTGKQGQDNDISYDPLEMMVNEAHKRHMEVHAWINPYRITMPTTDTQNLAPNHLYFKHPDWFWKYNNQYYFEPGRDETIQWICRVVADIVSRYNIDGIHMDDYFYPYPDRKTSLPDYTFYKKHQRGFSDINEWRRNNVNKAVKALHDTIKSIKPDVQFGISPFGIWRNKTHDPKGSKTNGMQTYDDQYADVLLWMKNGWIDYVVPQLYWAIGHKNADHKELSYWWASQAGKTKVYIGMAAYQQKEPAASSGQNPWTNGNELCRQMRLHRQIPKISGEVFFSAKPLLKNPAGICDSLKLSF